MAVELLKKPKDPIDRQLIPIRGELIQIETDEPTVNGMREQEWPIPCLIQAAFIRNRPEDAIRVIVQSKTLTPEQRAHNMRMLLSLS